jgi:biopolymer transport protein ExbD
MSLDALPGRLDALKSSDGEAKVFIHGDKAAPFGLVVSVLDSVRKSGIKRTAIRTIVSRK